VQVREHDMGDGFAYKHTHTHTSMCSQLTALIRLHICAHSSQLTALPLTTLHTLHMRSQLSADGFASHDVTYVTYALTALS
jgi:hypothetical protein